MSEIIFKNHQLLINGQNTRLISGAIHFFRVHPDLWDDRLDKAVAFGLNCIETYVPWNLIEEQPGQFDFTGLADVETFLDKVHAHGLYAIVRPGPYICAEWDNGGIPAYVMSTPGVQIRRMNGPWLEAVDRYYKELIPRLAAKQFTKGGAVIMMQVENEYGSFCHDKEYLRHIRKLMLDLGVDVPLFTSDGPGDHFLQGGTLPECIQTVNFGSNSKAAFAAGRKYRPDGPDFCMEFWNGWFDHWGEKHHVRTAEIREDSADYELNEMLSAGASVNFYMFHGGTNFAFYNGANGHPGFPYAATVTSYDYDCPLSEAGDCTPKFLACQEVIRKHSDNPRIAPIQNSRKIAPPAVTLTGSACLRDSLDILSAPVASVSPLRMEDLPQNFGFIHYKKHLSGPVPSVNLLLLNVNDFAQVWLDGKYLGQRFRENGDRPFSISIPEGGAELEILVENCGRINYGPYTGKDFKGIAGAVCICLQEQVNWENRGLPLKSLDGLQFKKFQNAPATFHRGVFELKEIGDTFLNRPGKKGLVWINGFNLGRYWEVGPTETLYVPAPVLKEGPNEIIVLELEELKSSSVTFADTPDLGQC